MSVRMPAARLLWAGVCGLVTLVLLVASGCAAATPESPPSASSTGEQPCIDRGLAPFGCASFRSVSGSDASGPVSWLSTTPLTLTFSVLNYTPTLIIVTPCNTLNVPITISADHLTPHENDIVVGTKGCIGSAADHEAWARQLVSSPLSYSLQQDELHLHGSDQSILLTRNAASPR
ncbi:hypothetical protein ABCS02_11760 [Microbacterium sp. X-17]|uniref:hypothetical protein n=1 Tax=Microbacterium sp. X-17 TaxID=3144404 RepID=UPI0031F4DD48